MIVAEITDQEIVDHILLLQDEVERTGQALDSLKREMEIRLRNRGAGEAMIDGAKCILKYRSPVYDKRILTALWEAAPLSEVQKAYTEEHTETVTVKEKWNGNVLNQLSRKYGGDVARIIEQARIDQGAMIIVTKKDDDMILEEEKAWQHK